PTTDADAVRREIDEFEAAVERAHRDTGERHVPATPPTPRTYHQNDLPEGAEQ
ncbi:hypothetical protein SZN_36274, partial [Streptomyces zinciresistens K42]